MLETRLRKNIRIQRLFNKTMEKMKSICPYINNSILAASNKFGTKSEFAESYKWYPTNCEMEKECKKQDQVAIKKIPLPRDELKYYLEPNSYNALGYETWAEVESMKLCNILLENYVCPNLPLLVYAQICDNCIYVKKKLRSLGSSCLLIASELAVEDLKTWSAKDRSEEEWLSCYFQIFVGIYAIQKYWNMIHNDLHWGNILVHKVPKKQEYVKYTIDGLDYYLKNTGFQFVLWDFGKAYIPGKMGRKRTKMIKRKWYVKDYNRISEMAYWAKKHNRVKVPKSIINLAKELDAAAKHETLLEEVIPEFFFDVYKEKPDKSVVEKYSLDKSISLNVKSNNFVNSIFDHMQVYKR